MSVIIFIISLAILILVHEFGHFIVAKKSGIRVDEFGLGFPPKLWGKKIGETEYTLNTIPFGGFVKIFGEDPHSEDISEADKSRSFSYKSKWIQAAVLVAGVSANILFAWLLMSFGYMIGLPAPVDHSGPGQVTDAALVVVSALPNSPASAAGLQSGDTLRSLSADSKTLSGPALTSDSLSSFIQSTKGPLTVSYTRGSASYTATVNPSNTIISGKRAIGISMDMIGRLKLPFFEALAEGGRTTIYLLKGTASGLFNFLKSLVTFSSDFSQVSGPVGIAGTVARAENLGFVYILSLVAIISINLAVINLVPFPALDGGRLLFVAIEAIIRRPISRTVVQWTNAIGFALLLILMFVITGHDIIKLL